MPTTSADIPEGREELPVAVRRRFQTGDADALGVVYDRYGRSVWAVALQVTRAEHLAQEATQEAFIRAWRAAGTYDPERALGPWLLGIARYAALDVLRRELRPTRGGHEAEQDAVVEAPAFDRMWLSWTVREALRELSDDDREIVKLTFYEDLTHTQIAERLNVPVGTVKSRSHRLYRRLAKLLDHVRDGPEADTAAAAAPGNRTAPASRTSEEASGEQSRRG